MDSQEGTSAIEREKYREVFAAHDEELEAWLAANNRIERGIKEKERQQQQRGQKKVVVALEGLLGVGKSTLAQTLARAFPGQVAVFEEQVNQAFLRLFYGDPQRYAFAMQWGMLQVRTHQLQLAQHFLACHGSDSASSSSFSSTITATTATTASSNGLIRLWDRSMLGDYVFAIWNHLTGSITASEMRVYESQAGGTLEHPELLPLLQSGQEKIQLVVLLDDEPEACKQRVSGERRNDSEQGIPLNYYQGLDDVHFWMMLQLWRCRAVPTLVLNWTDYCVLSQTGLERLLRCFSFQQQEQEPQQEQAEKDEPKRAEVVWEKSVPEHHHPPQQHHYVYSSAQELEQDYALRPTAEQLKDVRHAWVPLADSDAGQYAGDGVLPLYRGVRRYKPAFKRLVLWHLSCGRSVHFY
jgi:deoxyadenosine/deoxycytidine kinase